MFSPEFTRFLFSYQKNEFMPKAEEKKCIRFKNKFGKLAEVLIPVKR